MFDYNNNILQISFANLWFTTAAARNDNSTLQLHNEFDLFIPLLRTDFCKRLPLFELPRIWDEFNDTDIQIFLSKTHLKNLRKII
jgi:hypothetical protein